MNRRRTLFTELGVFAAFNPELPASYRKAEYVLLANIAPALQNHVLDQVAKPRFIIADTMDLWLNTAMSDLLKLLKRVDALVLNDTEAQQLAQEDNVVVAAGKLHKLGPKYVIIKKGEHGSLLSGPSGFFIAPAYPLKKVVDPTGAGDTFVGGLIGYLASKKGDIEKNLRQAIIYGSVTASFCCEGFGLSRTTKVKLADIKKRVGELSEMSKA
jgi:sugar/nucleoside kinase (ribokinase family)